MIVRTFIAISLGMMIVCFVILDYIYIRYLRKDKK
jgi:hypothetical protein